jgi:predicted anti-sigma-YlaC factor YlaD
MLSVISTYSHTQHITDEDVAAFLCNAVSAEQKELIVFHLSNCDECRSLVAKVVLTFPMVSDPEEPSY